MSNVQMLRGSLCQEILQHLVVMGSVKESKTGNQKEVMLTAKGKSHRTARALVTSSGEFCCQVPAEARRGAEIRGVTGPSRQGWVLQGDLRARRSVSPASSNSKPKERQRLRARSTQVICYSEYI